MFTPYLDETFQSAASDPRLSWFNAPPVARNTSAGLSLETAAPTDFWQRTHYGFQNDTGHFLFTPVSGDFVLTTHVAFHPAHLYDQAGLMVRLSPNDWIKTSLEYEGDQPAHLGAVVTNLGYSDWSTQAYPREAGELDLRIRREGPDYLVEALLREPGREQPAWSQLRMAHLHGDDGQGPVQCGLYACSPVAAGYQVTFSFLRIALGRLG